MATCIHCEAESPESSRYCTVCGSPTAGVVQTASDQDSCGEGIRCRKCGAMVPKRSVFCNACGYYLKKRNAVAILVLSAAAITVLASLLLVFDREWLGALLLFLLIGIIGAGWISMAFFGLSARHYWQWKARMQKKREPRE